MIIDTLNIMSLLDEDKQQMEKIVVQELQRNKNVTVP